MIVPRTKEEEEKENIVGMENFKSPFKRISDERDEIYIFHIDSTLDRD